MHVIKKFFDQLENYTPEEYNNVTEEQVNFARDTVVIFVNRFNKKQMEDIEINDDRLLIDARESFVPLDTQNHHLPNFYITINKFNVLQGGIFEPLTKGSYQINKEYYDNNWRKAEQGRMAMALYTIQGLAHLIHVVWPIAQNVLYVKKCNYYGQYGIFFEEGVGEDNEDWLKFATRQSQSAFKVERGGIGGHMGHGQYIRPCNDDWITFYLARIEGEFEYTLAEIMPPQRPAHAYAPQYPGESSYGQAGTSMATPVFSPLHEIGEISYADQPPYLGTPQHFGTPHYTPQHFGTPHHTPQRAGTSQGTPQYGGQVHRVRKQKKGVLSSLFSCFTPKAKKDRRRKRSISNIFLDKIVRQKRMQHAGGPSGSRTPTRGSSLTVTDCGHWLAPIWFGFNVMLFILGWMLLAIQYYPMFLAM